MHCWLANNGDTRSRLRERQDPGSLCFAAGSIKSMKVLFLSGAIYPDYLCDMLFHGLRETLGADAVDSQRMWFMYQDDVPPQKKCLLYGKGFTLYGILPDIEVDRTDIEAKIRTRYFDIVVYGSIWRNLDHWDLVRQFYPSSKVAFIDGEDYQTLRSEFLGRGLYFKRECTRQSHGCIPLTFAIPKCKVRSYVPPKTKVLASLIPGRIETYVFDDEKAYFDDYAESMFAVTRKKGGWDCLRHYEILANGCIPYFENLRFCPSHTLVTLPKRFLRGVQRWFPNDVASVPPRAFEICRAFAAGRLTTEVLAADFLDAMRVGKRTPPPSRTILDAWTKGRHGC